jgi:hypothetical protein
LEFSGGRETCLCALSRILKVTDASRYGKIALYKAAAKSGRANEVISRLRGLLNKAECQAQQLEAKDLIQEVLK